MSTWKEKIACLILPLFILMGCSSTKIQHSQPINLYGNRIGVANFVNNTDTPLADVRAKNITSSLLEIYQVRPVNFPQPAQNVNIIPGIYPAAKESQVREWARRNNLCYVMYGEVNEWRYKVGLDGEPVVGLTLMIKNTSNNEVIWNSVGSKTGCSRCALSMTAQELISSMLSTMSPSGY